MADIQDILAMASVGSNIDKVRFKVYRGTNLTIDHMPKEDGALYFAYDTKKIFLDKSFTEDGVTEIRRIQMTAAAEGGSGAAGYLYIDADEDAVPPSLEKLDPEVDDLEDPNYYIYRSAFTDQIALPDIDTLLINSTGQFFRVIEQDGANDRVKAIIIASAGAGGGGGGGSSTSTDDLELNLGQGWGSNRVYIYGQENLLEISGICTRGKNPEVNLSIIVQDGVSEEVLLEDTPIIASGASYYFDTAQLPINTNLTISVGIDSAASRMRPAHKKALTRIMTGVKVFRMDLAKTNADEFLPLRGDTADGTTNHTLNFIATGASFTSEVLHVYIDGEEDLTLKKNLSAEGDGRSQSLSIPHQSHGVHEISLQLSTIINNVELVSNVITYQCAWVTRGDTAPIIWIGNYDETVVNYEYSYIKYMVYDPQLQAGDEGTEVLLYKNGEEIGQLLVNYQTEWLIWDITSSYEVGANVFSISCRGEKVDLTVNVITEGSRDLSLVVPESLLANYSTTGRSNDEIISNRNRFASSVGNSEAILSGFNWQNNGWGQDEVTGNEIDNGAYLTIANGAAVSIPIPTQTHNLLLNSETNYSFEIRFRIHGLIYLPLAAKIYCCIIPLQGWYFSSGNTPS